MHLHFIFLMKFIKILNLLSCVHVKNYLILKLKFWEIIFSIYFALLTHNVYPLHVWKGFQSCYVLCNETYGCMHPSNGYQMHNRLNELMHALVWCHIMWDMSSNGFVCASKAMYYGNESIVCHVLKGCVMHYLV
jgi:hypothetical protein